MYNWNETKIQQDYFANDKVVLKECGLVPDPELNMPEASQTECLICMSRDREK